MELPVSDIVSLSSLSLSKRAAHLPLPGLPQLGNKSTAKLERGRGGIAMEIAIATSPVADLESRISAINRLANRGKGAQGKVSILGRALLQELSAKPTVFGERGHSLHAQFLRASVSCISSLGGSESLGILEKVAVHLKTSQAAYADKLAYVVADALLGNGAEGERIAKRELPNTLEDIAGANGFSHLQEYHAQYWRGLREEIISGKALELSVHSLLSNISNAPSSLFNSELLTALEQSVANTTLLATTRCQALQLLARINRERAAHASTGVLAGDGSAAHARLILWSCREGILSREHPESHKLISALLSLLKPEAINTGAVMTVGLLRLEASVDALKQIVERIASTSALTTDSPESLENNPAAQSLLALRLIRSEQALVVLNNIASTPRGWLRRWREHSGRRALRPLAQKLLQEDSGVVESRCRRLLDGYLAGFPEKVA